MDDFIAHFGIKRRSGRYPWGSGERPYQGEGGSPAPSPKAPKDPEKMRRKDMIKRSNLRNMTTQELKDAIDRMRQEKELKNLVEDDIAPGKKAIKKILADVGSETAKTVLKGSINYGIKRAITDEDFDANELAEFIFPKKKKKD